MDRSYSGGGKEKPLRYERIGGGIGVGEGGVSAVSSVLTLFGVVLLTVGFVVYAIIVGQQTADIQNRMATIVSVPVNASCGGTVAETRRALAYQKRIDNAHAQYSVGVPCHTNNGDEDLYASTHFASYSKGLQHDSLGHVLPASYAALKKAALSEVPSNWDAVPLAAGATFKLVNPQAGNAFVNEGADSRAIFQKPAPAFASAQAAGEMVEVYWMALARDVPFANYTTDPLIAQAAASISLLSDYRGHQPVTTANLFRGKAPGCDVGPHVSQFMYLPCPFGANSIDQKMYPQTPGVNFMTNFSEYLRIQNGQTPAAAMSYLPTKRHIIDGRDLSGWVRVDVLFQAYFHAMLILMEMGAPLKAGIPYQTSSLNQQGFGTFGNPWIAQMTTNSAVTALKTVWYQKWNVHRRLRPEVMAARVHNHKTSAYVYPLHNDVLNSNVLTAVFNLTGTYLLPMAFAEGSPHHPSYGAGHASVAGAATTILKAIFQEDYVLPAPVMPTADGLNIVPLSPSVPLTVGGELNKLAANVGIGRHHAGVHYMSDAVESFRLGQEVAISILRDMRNTFPEPFAGFSFNDFDGNLVRV